VLVLYVILDCCWIVTPDNVARNSAEMFFFVRFVVGNVAKRLLPSSLLFS